MNKAKEYTGDRTAANKIPWSLIEKTLRLKTNMMWTKMNKAKEYTGDRTAANKIPWSLIEKTLRIKTFGNMTKRKVPSSRPK